MAGPTVDSPTQIQAGAPGVAMIGSNTRVRGQLGFLGTQQDSLSFGNGATGFWIAANTRTRTLGVFLVSQSAQGTAQPPSGSPVPVLVVNADPKIRSL